MLTEYTGKRLFDVIYSEESIHCLPKNDAEILLAKIAGWLDPQGVFFVSTSVEDESSEGFEQKRTEIYGENSVRYRARYTEPEFREMLTKNFEILESEIYDNRGIDVIQAYFCRREKVR